MVNIDVLKIGSMRVTLYEHYDFTGYVTDFTVQGFFITFNSSLSPYFKNYAKKYSITLQGSIRSDYNNLYNYTVDSNKQVRAYIGGELVLLKNEFDKMPRWFLREMHQYQ